MFTASSPSFSQQSRREFNARAVYLSFSYNFGRPPRLRMPQPQQQDQPPLDQPGMPGPGGAR